MRRIRPDLWETSTESPFPGLTTHAYLLERAGGNVLFYNTSHTHELDRIAELGGIAYQLLSHRDEIGESLNTILERFGSSLGGHIAEKAEFGRYRRPDLLLQQRERIGRYRGHPGAGTLARQHSLFSGLSHWSELSFHG